MPSSQKTSLRFFLRFLLGSASRIEMCLATNATDPGPTKNVTQAMC